MTLDQWIALSPIERNEIRFGWRWRYGEPGEEYRHWEREGLPLVSEAADRFRREYGEQPLINCVFPTVNLFGNGEPAIHVVTALFPPQQIEDLPDRFATFAVRQEAILSSKESYLTYWRLVLGEVLGWAGQQVDEWAAKKWQDGLDGKEPWFYHESPCWYIAPLLVASDVKARLTDSDFQAVCDAVGEPASASCKPYDWPAAKERLRRVIERFREG